MRKIEKYYTTQWEFSASDKKIIRKGDCSVGEEVFRPDEIRIITSKEVKIHICLSIYGNKPNVYPENYQVFIKELNYNSKYENLPGELNQNEFTFLKDQYDFYVKEEKSNEKILFADNSKVNPLYSSSGYLVYIEGKNGEELLLIYFNRWQSEVQPRGAGEDQLGEDVTYIQGIWEDPLLTDEIIAKIKST